MQQFVNLPVVVAELSLCQCLSVCLSVTSALLTRGAIHQLMHLPVVVAVHLNSTREPTTTRGELVHVLISISSPRTGVTAPQPQVHNRRVLLPRQCPLILRSYSDTASSSTVCLFFDCPCPVGRRAAYPPPFCEETLPDVHLCSE